MNVLRCSVVIPTRNRAGLLARCLGALAKQTPGPEEMEIIVVDDGSTDGTGERVQAFDEGMPFKVRVLKGFGRGPAAARNLGWRAAQAPIVLFTDDDCEPSTGWSQALVDFLEANPVYGGAGGKIWRLKDSVAARFTDDTGCMNHPGEPNDVIYLVSANASYRRSVLESVNGFNELFPCAGGEDPDLSMRVKALGVKLASVENAVILHNHPDSVCGVYRMHHRYGRGEFGLLQAGGVMTNDRGTVTRLLAELRRSMAVYRRRSDLGVTNRLLFGLLAWVRCYALFAGFRFQECQLAQLPKRS